MKPEKTSKPEQTLEQMRMRFALMAVKHSTDSTTNPAHLTEAQFKEFATRCHSLPAQILQNGLNQALAFCLSRTGEQAVAYKALMQYVSDWLTGRGLVASMNLAHTVAVMPLPPADERGIVDVLLEHDIDTYMAATQEALALLHHLKRFASAFKTAEKPEADDGS